MGGKCVQVEMMVSAATFQIVAHEGEQGWEKGMWTWSMLCMKVRAISQMVADNRLKMRQLVSIR
eukprot:2858821-Amphidinium_carterae.1